MQFTLTPQDMKALETRFMAQYALPSALLMEHAAQGVVRALQKRCPRGRALFLCGPGNNGGDGYAAARLWQDAGGSSHILALPGTLAGDAAMNRDLAALAGVPIRTPEDPAALSPLPPCDVIVDALFGTGLSRAPEGLAAALIRTANASGKPVVALDIPSGLDGLTGQALGPAIRAAETVTFHRVKQGLLLRDGPDFTGDVTCWPILIPQGYGDQPGLAVMETSDLRRIPRRNACGHKGTFGQAVIFAGSRGMAGAAAFAANACVKTGAGLTKLLCRESLLPTLQILAPGAVCVPLTEERGRLTAEAVSIARAALHTADAAAIGCGLAQTEDLLPLLPAFREARCPVVWDADGLNLLSRHPSLLPLPSSAFITPHPGEAARLLQCDVRQVTDEPLSALERLRQRTGAQVLLKGPRTLMAAAPTADDAAPCRAVNLFGTPALAKGGSGDVLTGILTALLARSCVPPLQAMQLAAMIHGLAGLRGAARWGTDSLTPQGLIEMIRLEEDG